MRHWVAARIPKLCRDWSVESFEETREQTPASHPPHGSPPGSLELTFEQSGAPVHSWWNVVSNYALWPSALTVLALAAACGLSFCPPIRRSIGRHPAAWRRLLFGAAAATVLSAVLLAGNTVRGWVDLLPAAGATLLFAGALTACGAMGLLVSCAWRDACQRKGGVRSALSAICVLLAVNLTSLACAALDDAALGDAAQKSQDSAENQNVVCLRAATSLQPVQGVLALTDQGRPIELFAASRHSTGGSSTSSVDGESSPGARWLDEYGGWYQVIATQEPQVGEGGHGLVFTAGRFQLRDESIAAILADNGYRQVALPAPGDLIVYRDGAQRIMHSGVVKFVADDGLVVIDSQLGAEQRVLHRPDGAGFAHFAHGFYRSSRGGHLLSIVAEPGYETKGSGRSGGDRPPAASSL